MGLSNKLNVPSYRTVNNRIRDYHYPIISFSSIITFSIYWVCYRLVFGSNDIARTSKAPLFDSLPSQGLCCADNYIMVRR